MSLGPRSLRRGIALIMSLLMGVFVVVMALVLLAWVQSDNDFAARTAMEMRAYDLARGGLDYYRIHPDAVTPVATVTVDPAAGDNFVVTHTLATGDVTSEGIVIRGTKTYTRTLIVPRGNFPNIIDEGTQ